MPVRWVALDEAYEAVLRGQLHNPGALIGILAAQRPARATGPRCDRTTPAGPSTPPTARSPRASSRPAVGMARA